MEFKKTIENISDEKKNLTINLREYQTQISLLRSEIAQLRTIANDKEVNRYNYKRIFEYETEYLINVYLKDKKQIRLAKRALF
jgi:hypothetical protein